MTVKVKSVMEVHIFPVRKKNILNIKQIIHAQMIEWVLCMSMCTKCSKRLSAIKLYGAELWK